MKYNNKQIKEFLAESNAIEQVYGTEALENALIAWKYIRKQGALTPGIIQETHFYLMKDLRPDIAGFWRTCDVWIGGKKKKFESIQRIEERMERFCLAMAITATAAVRSLMDYEKLTKEAHVTFEDVHPFEDGNGRVGRLIYLWHREKLGLPIHIIHADWPLEDGEQKAYYQWFK